MCVAEANMAAVAKQWRRLCKCAFLSKKGNESEVVGTIREHGSFVPNY